jgi:hypothetical protein
MIDFNPTPTWSPVADLDRSFPAALGGLLIERGVQDVLANVAEQVHRLRPGIELGFALWGSPPTPQRMAHIGDVQPLDTRSTMGSVEIEPDCFAAGLEALSARNRDGGELMGVAHTHPGDGIATRSFTDLKWHSRLLDDHNRAALRMEIPVECEAGRLMLPVQSFFSVVLNESAELDRATGYLLLRVREGGVMRDVEYAIPLYLAQRRRESSAWPRFRAAVSAASGWSYDVRFSTPSGQPGRVLQ